MRVRAGNFEKGNRAGGLDVGPAVTTIGLVSRRTRSSIIKLRAFPEEVTMLRDLAETTGLSQSDVIRQLIRREHAEKLGEQPLYPEPKR